MSNELQAIQPEQLTPDIVKQRICQDATDQEIFLFLQIAKSCKLNPFLNQIYLVKYGGNKAQILTSYNVYLQRAERSGAYAGLETSTEGSVEQNNLKAVVKVFRKDWDRPLIHEVWYEEYVQKKNDGTPNRFWKEKPRTMITKVAISQAFRLAFPLDFEGMPYTQDEINTIDISETTGQAKSEPFPMPVAKTDVVVEKVEPIAVSASKKTIHNGPDIEKVVISPEGEELHIITEDEGKALLALAKKNGYDKTDVKVYAATLGYDRLSKMNIWDMETCMEYFSKPHEQRLKEAKHDKK